MAQTIQKKVNDGNNVLSSSLPKLGLELEDAGFLIGRERIDLIGCELKNLHKERLLLLGQVLSGECCCWVVGRGSLRLTAVPLLSVGCRRWSCVGRISTSRRWTAIVLRRCRRASIVGAGLLHVWWNSGGGGGATTRRGSRSSEDALQNLRVDHVHHEHGLEEGIG